MGKNVLTTAQNIFLKAKKLHDAFQFKKAAKNYHSAGLNFLKVEDLEKAVQSFILGAESYIEAKKFKESVELLRLAANIYLDIEDFDNAFKIFKDIMKIVPKITDNEKKNNFYILFPTLSYLCLFVEGKQEEGLKIIKKYQKNVDSDFFKEHYLIKLITDLTISTRKKSEKHLEKIFHYFENFKLKEKEIDLLKKALFLTRLYLNTESILSLDKEVYTTNDLIRMTLILKTSHLMDTWNDIFNNVNINEIEIENIDYKMSDNLNIHEKPALPIKLDMNKDETLHFVIKPNFQKDGSYIGPLEIKCKINNKLVFTHATDVIQPNLISPPPVLEISMRNLRTPLIGQTFPIEFTLHNVSEGEAIDIDVNVEFPEEIKIMRGTISKQIYSLRQNEEIKWELNIKPLEAGDHVIIARIKFKDPDQNPIELIKEFPYSINL
ncbi:MAG: hypothetical protein ACTSRH_11485 [Promethearchaeota archaeon]